MIDNDIPSIADTFADIQRFSSVPLDERLDYNRMRSEALALKGLAGYEAAKAEALAQFDRIVAMRLDWDALPPIDSQAA